MMTSATRSGVLPCADSVPATLANGAVVALIEEAALSPKPGLVDPRGVSAHDDMNVETLIASAHALGPIFAELAEMSADRAPDVQLRREVGAAGRRGEKQMLEATGGVNTHRGALWALGLLICGAANFTEAERITEYAAQLAALPDMALPVAHPLSHGALAQQRYQVSGARGEAQLGFPHVLLALRALRDARATGLTIAQARMHALMELIARLDDTCLLFRGGSAGLTAMQQAARTVLSAGGPHTPCGARALARMDRQARRRHLSPGGSGDLLAAAIFLDELTRSTHSNPVPST